MTASSSSSEIPREPYDVFISFRGEDTRFNFTSHLHSALKNKQIKTYFDEFDLSPGEEISPALLRAIEDSQLSVIVFSKHYANSSWCLDELLHILWCKDNLERQVIPVFYHVDPFDVRRQRRSYEEAFKRLEQRPNADKDKLESWRSALKEAADLSGFSTQDTRFRSEPNLIEAIVEDIIKKLNATSSVFEGAEKLVGIEQSVEQIESLLQIGSSGVRAIGIWGQGGIGKTTLAKYLFWKLNGEFPGRCFLEDVRENWEKHGDKCHLRNKLFSDLLKEKDMNLITSFMTPASVTNRLGRTKSLIVLDDVNDKEQLKSLIGCREWLGDGSRIIVTSRDAQCLRKLLVDDIYQVKGLKSDEAGKLFSSNAFERSSKAPYPTELIQWVVTYAEGIPLVLEVLGSLFKHSDIKDWETLRLRLYNSGDGENIQNALMSSYNALTENQKRVFLFIAFCFKGGDRHFVERILGDKSFHVESTIDDLVAKSLITINDFGMVCMHDLVQEMGLKVIQQESSYPGKRRLLCDAQEIQHVLDNNMAIEKIEGMVLDTSQIEELNLSPDVFKRLYKLRWLEIFNSSSRDEKTCKLRLPGGLQSLPNSLKYVRWDDYPSKSLPLKFPPEQLVEIIMRESQLEKLWDGVQNLPSLRKIDLSSSRKLTEIPNLSNAPNLEKITLDFCSSLIEVPSDKIQNLDRLLSLSMYSCHSLQALPHIIQSAKNINLINCKKLGGIPEIIKENVVVLRLAGSGIKELPQWIGYFHNLTEFSLQSCQNLKKLPSSIRQLKLYFLNLSGCSSLEEIPELLPTTLTELYMDETVIEEVPSSSIEQLSNLKIFSLRKCSRLRTLPTSLYKLNSLEKLDLIGCPKLEVFPEISEPMKKFRFFGQNQSQEEIPVSNLKNLLLMECHNLHSLPELMWDVSYLDATGCTSLESVSSSRSAILKYFPKDIRFNRNVIMHNFFNCLKLNQNARDNIIADWLLRSFRCAIYADFSYRRSAEAHYICCTCYPGSEIPEWFIHRAEGDSITIKPPSIWSSDNFLGFSLCLVTTPEGVNVLDLLLEVDLYLLASSGERRIFKFKTSLPMGALNNASSDHVYMLSDYNTSSEVYSVAGYSITEVSFHVKGGRFLKKVKRVGMRMLYHQDADNLGVSIPPVWHPKEEESGFSDDGCWNDPEDSYSGESD